MKKELVVKLNKYLADVAVSYIKMHNLHWNIVGSQFKAVHEYLETIYDSYADVLDEVAEALRMNDELPIASLKDYLEVTSIKELDSKEISIVDALNITIEDIKTLKAEAFEIRNDADEQDLYSIVDIMEDNISNYEKTLWFLKSTVR
jgi:neutrophil-activating protein A